MLKNMDPPLGFGSKCPDRLAYKKLIRMNMPLDNEGKVNFTTTLFALIRENLSIKMRSAEEMDQADVELRETILKVWPFTAKEKIELLVPTTRGKIKRKPFVSHSDEVSKKKPSSLIFIWPTSWSNLRSAILCTLAKLACAAK